MRQGGGKGSASLRQVAVGVTTASSIVFHLCGNLETALSVLLGGSCRPRKRLADFSCSGSRQGPQPFLGRGQPFFEDHASRGGLLSCILVARFDVKDGVIIFLAFDVF